MRKVSRISNSPKYFQIFQFYENFAPVNVALSFFTYYPCLQNGNISLKYHRRKLIRFPFMSNFIHWIDFYDSTMERLCRQIFRVSFSIFILRNVNFGFIRETRNKSAKKVDNIPESSASVWNCKFSKYQ